MTKRNALRSAGYTPLTQEKLLLLGLAALVDAGRERSNERAGRVQVFAEAPRNARIKVAK